jgi:hypothetical protein
VFVNKDTFSHVLPKYPKPIASDPHCYMEDLCVADEGEEFFAGYLLRNPSRPITNLILFATACLRPRRPFLLHGSTCFYLRKMVLHGKIRSKRLVFLLDDISAQPKCRHICVFQFWGRDSLPSESGDES